MNIRVGGDRMDALFERFRDVLQRTPLLASDSPLPRNLLLSEDDDVSVYYAPSGPLNLKAEVVLVGLTPSQQQARDAINAAGEALRNGLDADEAQRRAKAAAVFFAARREALANSLDAIDLGPRLGLQSCAALFDERQDLLHATSLLRYPVLADGASYAGSPHFFRCALLKRLIDHHFTPEALELGQALFVPLGPVVTEALQVLVTEGVIDEGQLLTGAPYPALTGTDAARRNSAGATVRSALRARMDWMQKIGRAS